MAASEPGAARPGAREKSLARIIRGRISLRKRNFLLKAVLLRSYLHSKLSSTPVVYVIGDSHTGIFLKRRPFIVHWLGPATAYNLGAERSTTDSWRKLRGIIEHAVRPQDKVLLVFGEVDCRIHIYNQYVRNREAMTIDDVVDVTIEKYGEALERLEGMGVDFYVASVPPGGREGNVFGVPNYPPLEMRCAINEAFNRRLGVFCDEHGFRFANVYPQVVDEDGFIKPEYSYPDGTHLNTNAVGLFAEQMGIAGWTAGP